MRTPNRFFLGNRFISAARWIEHDGPFLLWPAAWVEWGLEPVLSVRVHRWTLGVGRARVQLDWGVWNRRDPKALIDWRASGLDGFLAWARSAFSQSWGRGDLDRLFRERPEWRALVGLGDGRAHYIRLLLARELASAPASRLGPEREMAEGLSALETALGMDEGLLESTGAEASRTAGASAATPPPQLRPGARR